MRHGVSDRGSSLRSWTALTRVRVEVGPGVDTPLPARTESSPVSRETRHQGGRRFLRARRPALKTAVRPYGRKTEQLLATKESVDRRYFTRRACRTTTAPRPPPPPHSKRRRSFTDSHAGTFGAPACCRLDRLICTTTTSMPGTCVDARARPKGL